MKRKVPIDIRPESSKQKTIRDINTYNAMKATELHKYYIESGAQFTMTFSKFKRKHKGKKQ
jgi:hypothetical protein